jgi:hypothetical protein
MSVLIAVMILDVVLVAVAVSLLGTLLRKTGTAIAVTASVRAGALRRVTALVLATDRIRCGVLSSVATPVPNRT